MRLKGQWIYTKYDQFGRVAYTGIKTGINTSLDVGLTRAAEQADANTFGFNSVDRGNVAFFNRQGMDVYYGSSDLTYPKSPTWVTMLSLNYYDSYPGYGFNPSLPANTPDMTVLTGTPTTDGRSTKGLPVMSFVKNIEDDSWTKNYTYYDQKGRVIGTHSINHLGGYTHTESKLDFAGLPQQTITRHKRLASDTERVITETFEYDHQNRLLVHKHQIDGNGTEILTQNTYNEISQLSGKKVGGTDLSNPLQNISYAYNIRGWMTKINDPKNLGANLFGYEIKYNKVEGLEVPNTEYPNHKVQPKYNGNIVEVDWKTATDSNGNLRRYGYVYDTLNRLTGGFYQKDSNPSGKEYNELMAYDVNGNILNLVRTQEALPGSATAVVIDNLVYTYTGNKLNNVSDAYLNNTGYPVGGNEISYDSNGNMTSHMDKGISSIQYNYLNLPKKVTQNSKVTDYIYRADGVKVKKIFDTKTTDYLDGFQYENSTLKFFPTSEGYFNVETGKYVYNYMDHLRNIRLSYAKNGAGIEIIEESNYYPFGLKHEGYNVLSGNSAYNYKYNGKELQETGMYDYGARMYMADIGRWGVVDPLAEKTRRFNPYNYALDNPIRFIDPDGRSETDWLQRGNQIFFDSEIKSQEQATAKYGENAQHLSEGSSITTKENGEIVSQYTFHDDGTITNADGSQKSSKETFETKDGTTIIGTESKGASFTFGVNGVLGGGFGFDIGLVKDSGNNWGMFFNRNINVGFGADLGVGMGIIKPTHSGPFLLNDYPGESKSFNVGVSSPIGGIGGAYGGTFDSKSTPLQMINPTNVGYGTNGYTEVSRSPIQGPSPKIGAGIYLKRSKTAVWDF